MELRAPQNAKKFSLVPSSRAFISAHAQSARVFVVNFESATRVLYTKIMKSPVGPWPIEKLAPENVKNANNGTFQTEFSPCARKSIWNDIPCDVPWYVYNMGP